MCVNDTRNSKWGTRYEGPFTVVRQSEGGAYVLADANGDELPAKRTIEMLVPIPSKPADALCSPATSGPEDAADSAELAPVDALAVSGSDGSANSQVEVQSILDHRYTPDGHALEYLVRWKGYDSSHDEWVLQDNFVGEKPLRFYWAKLKGKPRAADAITIGAKTSVIAGDKSHQLATSSTAQQSSVILQRRVRRVKGSGTTVSKTEYLVRDSNGGETWKPCHQVPNALINVYNKSIAHYSSETASVSKGKGSKMSSG
jgi:hypothetical protein